MELEILKQDKESIEVQLDNLTLVEILRVYLNRDGIEFAAWKRVHPSKPLIFKANSSGKTVKKAISDAVGAIKKDCGKILGVLKK